MHGVGYMRLSLKKLITGLLCVTLLPFLLLILYNHNPFCVGTNITLHNWNANRFLMSAFSLRSASSVLTENLAYLQHDASRRLLTSQTVAPAEDTCNKHPGKNIIRSCPSCYRPAVAEFGNYSFYEVMPQDSVFANQSAVDFNVRTEIVQELISDYMIAPMLNSCNVYLLAVQPSILDKRDERELVRNTWGSVAKQQMWPNRKINAYVKVVFVVARLLTANKDNSRNDSDQFDEIRSEADLYNDILYLDMIDSYRNLTLKILSAFKWVKDNCPCVRFVLKVDYDTFVNIPLLVDTLLYFEDRFQFSILGHFYRNTSQVRREGKWGVPATVYPDNMYPVYASGCGYVLSYKVLSRMVETVPYFPMLSIEDAFITGVMRRVIGCRVFTFPKLFTHYRDKNWKYSWIAEDKKMLGMSAGGLKHVHIWETCVRDAHP